MKGERVWYYLTDRVLSDARIEHVDDATVTASGMLRVPENDGALVPRFVGKRDWHRTLDQAKARAKQLRKAKKASLKRQFARAMRKLARPVVATNLLTWGAR